MKLPSHAEATTGTWERGLPPGKYYSGMEKDFEVYFTAGGWPWWRKKAAPTSIDPDGDRP